MFNAYKFMPVALFFMLFVVVVVQIEFITRPFFIQFSVCVFLLCPLLLLCMFVLHSYFQYPQSENEICGTATEMQLNWNWSQKPPANKCLKAIVSQNVSYLFIIWSLASHHTQALLYTIYNIYS